MDYKYQITNRLVEILEKVFAKNRSEFGRRVGVKESRIRSYTHEIIEERSMPSADFIALTIMNVEINPEWILFGKGDMFLKQEDVKMDATKENRLLKLIESQQETIASQQETLKILIGGGGKNDTAASV